MRHPRPRNLPTLVALEERLVPANIPLLEVPGITGTLPSAFNFNDPTNPDNLLVMVDWLGARGTQPDKLRVVPAVYDPLVQHLQATTYREEPELVRQVPYDWRMPLAPEDGVIDGRVRNITASQIAKKLGDSFTTCLDYLGYSLRKVAEEWLAANPGQPLQEVDIVAHSMGNLVTRAYVQSDAYGGYFTSSSGDVIPLPKVRNFVQMAPPNLGSGLAFPVWMGDDKPLVVTAGDEYASATAFPASASAQNTLVYGLFLMYSNVLEGTPIDGPVPITLESITVDGKPSPVAFVRQYCPTIGALVPTYAFLQQPDGSITGVQQNPAYAVPSITYDLNNGPGSVDLPPLVNRYDVVYGDSLPTVDLAVSQTAPPGTWYPLPATQFPGESTDLATVPNGQTYYNLTAKDNNGDTTVPLKSLSDLVNRPYVRQFPQQNPQMTHVGIMTNPISINFVTQLLLDAPDPELPPGVTAGTLPMVVTGNGPAVRIDFAGGGQRAMLEPFGNYDGEIRSAVGDVTGDGIADFVFTSGPGAATRVVVRDGVTLEQRASFWAYGEEFKGGATVAVVDLDGDSVCEILTGAGPGGAPHVVAFRGDGSATDVSFYAFDQKFRGGIQVAGGWLGSGLTAPAIPPAESFLSLPSVAPLLQASPNYQNQIVVTPLTGAGAHVVVYNSAGNQVLQSFLAFENDSNSGASVAVGDFMGTGYAQIAVAQGQGTSPEVRLFGSDGELARFQAFASGFTGGVRLGNIVPQAGYPALLGAGAGPGGRGTVNRFRMLDTTAQFVDGFFTQGIDLSEGVWVG